MKTELILTNNYKQILYVICSKSKEIKEDYGWLHHHTYTDLEKAKAGLKKLLAHNRYNLEYKIRKFVITGTDLFTDKEFPQIDKRDTCDCFYCNKLIQSGDELFFGDATEEIYCSTECLAKAMDNECITALGDDDSYYSWFYEKEEE